MIACSIFSDLFVNFAGAAFGAGIASGAALWIAHCQRRSIAKDTLRELLVSTLDLSFVKDGSKREYCATKFKADYSKILSAYLTYRSLILPCYRCYLTQQWEAYKGVSKQHEAFNSDYGGFFPPLDEKSFKMKTHGLLDALE